MEEEPTNFFTPSFNTLILSITSHILGRVRLFKKTTTLRDIFNTCSFEPRSVLAKSPPDGVNFPSALESLGPTNQG